MSSRVPRTGRLTAFAFALTLFWFSSAAAQTSAAEEKAEPLTLGSAVSTVLSAGESAFTEAARLLQSDPYWQFRGASYSNSGLMSEQDEVKLGDKLHAEFGRKFEIVTEGQARAERIGLRVARASLRPNLTYRFHVIRDKELNAFSGPGGHIYITTALMNLATDDEVASVLSHEVSHIVARHSLKTIQHSQNLRGLADLFGSVAGIAGSTAQELGTAAATIVASGALAVHNREEEREADFLGVHVMSKAGYNPQAMVTMFQKIQIAGKKDESLLGAVFADHPAVNERIENTRYEISRIR
ncbi:MAG TPA: M48 family metalloprotease [Pyrinomonadaceae bacterium]|nr:M48 family metalloprotease [Pyrinomonadaceae bacterium]